MRPMLLSDRYRAAKIAAALLTLWALHHFCGVRGNRFQPDYGACALNPAHNDGVRVWMLADRCAPRPDGSAVLTMTTRTEVLLVGRDLPSTPPPGGYLFVQGIFRTDPARVEVEKHRLVLEFPWKRRAMVAMSAAVLAACLGLGWRRFRWEAGAGWTVREPPRA